jgi:hypothetical protein
MRRLGIVGYWVVASAAVLTLSGAGLWNARLLAPLGRVLLFPKAGGWKGLWHWRRWAEAAGMTLVWAAVPWLLDLFIDDRLRTAGIALPWVRDSNIGGPAVWWWTGVACYFGLLYGRVSAGIIAGGLSLAWQWAFFGGWAIEPLRHYVSSDLVLRYLVYGLFLGLVLAGAEIIALLVPPRKRTVSLSS